jgi:hypothetical protein
VSKVCFKIDEHPKKRATSQYDDAKK